MKKIIFILFIIVFYTNNLKSQNTNTKSKVVVVFSPYCPICLKNIYILKNLYTTYGIPDSIDFQLLIPSTLHINNGELNKLRKKYKLPFSINNDFKNSFINKYEASVTPEVFLLDKEENVRYQGLINNRFTQIGVGNNGEIINYLEDAIKAYIKNEEIVIKRTTAIGCFIEPIQ